MTFFSDPYALRTRGSLLVTLLKVSNESAHQTIYTQYLDLSVSAIFAAFRRLPYVWHGKKSKGNLATQGINVSR